MQKTTKLSMIGYQNIIWKMMLHMYVQEDMFRSVKPNIGPAV